MPCADCEAFEKAYRTARNHHASIAASILKLASLKSDESRKLTIQAKVARAVVLMTKEALRAHKEGHKK